MQMEEGMDRWVNQYLKEKDLYLIAILNNEMLQLILYV